ncbi:hypothetical protein GALMADRAFT_251884 [Galerina marginata CBS 339.88]|uniref:Uncharacterized protein n=1 Tax=Galerina marginata (strain CBS 339.88) TaxID=685588 RepID=A0A067ST91_GALM3|nr:hypothetical protein GALMADRAFT_251884 [Galerina marginata CBS 339.88]
MDRWTGANYRMFMINVPLIIRSSIYLHSRSLEHRYRVRARYFLLAAAWTRTKWRVFGGASFVPQIMSILQHIISQEVLYFKVNKRTRVNTTPGSFSKAETLSQYGNQRSLLQVKTSDISRNSDVRFGAGTDRRKTTLRSGKNLIVNLLGRHNLDIQWGIWCSSAALSLADN